MRRCIAMWTRPPTAVSQQMPADAPSVADPASNSSLAGSNEQRAAGTWPYRDVAVYMLDAMTACADTVSQRRKGYPSRELEACLAELEVTLFRVAKRASLCKDADFGAQERSNLPSFRLLNHTDSQLLKLCRCSSVCVHPVAAFPMMTAASTSASPASARSSRYPEDTLDTCKELQQDELLALEVSRPYPVSLRPLCCALALSTSLADRPSTREGSGIVASLMASWRASSMSTLIYSRRERSSSSSKL